MRSPQSSLNISGSSSTLINNELFKNYNNIRKPQIHHYFLPVHELTHKL